MAIWIVERKRSGCSVIFFSFTAALLPSAISWSSRASLTEMTAISAQANTALQAMSTICNINCHTNVESKSNFLLKLKKT